MNNRDKFWDGLKFCLITLVVIGHLADEFTDKSDIYKSVFLFIYSFHMPLFIFISGLFYKSERIVEKVVFYISVGFLYKILTTLIDILKGSNNPTFTFLADGGPSWFMFVLAYYTIFAYILRNQNKKYIIIVVIFINCFLGYDSSVGDFLYLSRFMIFFPFFIIGTVIDRESILKLRNNKNFLISVMVLIVWAFICVHYNDKIYLFRYLFTGRNAFWDEIIMYGPLFRFMAYIISFLVGIAVLFSVPRCFISKVAFMGKNSLTVYFWHFRVYELLNVFFGVSILFNYGAIGKICFLIIGIFISIILSSLHIFSLPLEYIKKQSFNIKI